MPSATRPDGTALKFTFSNIGPITNAELELGDLTVIAGRNNTGKTYLVYTLYGFLKTWENWPGAALLAARPPTSAARARWAARYPVFGQITEQVTATGQAEIPVDPRALDRERNSAVNGLIRRFSQGRIAEVFSSSSEEFESASITIKLGTEHSWNARPVVLSVEPEDTLSIRYDGTNLFVIGDQPEGKPSPPYALGRRLWRLYLRFLLPELPSDPFVLSAERLGISIFYRELDFKKSQLVDLLQKYGDRESKDPDFPFHLTIGVPSHRMRSRA